MNSELKAGRYSGAIVLADISGYTAFLDNVRIAHQEDEFADGQIPDAYGLMSGLLDGSASNIDPPLTLVKFEGDAVFAVPAGEVAPRASAMLPTFLGGMALSEASSTGTRVPSTCCDRWLTWDSCSVSELS